MQAEMRILDLISFSRQITTSLDTIVMHFIMENNIKTILRCVNLTNELVNYNNNHSYDLIYSLF